MAGVLPRVVIDAFASERQYLEHLAPCWQALPADRRGAFYVAHSMMVAASLHGIGPLRDGRPGPGGPVMVASFQDHREARRVGRPVLFIEHGSGQQYQLESGPHPSYSGSPEHEGTILFICPSETVADRWRARYPDVPAVAVGVPKLDGFHAGPPRARARTLNGATVAISHHCDLALCPETRSAWRHYDPHLPAVVAALRDGGAHVIGHAHPRLFRRVEHRWRECGAEPVGDFATVLARADVYACDNSSTLPEAASCGIPLVWMNAPWWRRDVDHGGRFYRWPAGQVSCDRPADLPGAVVEALADRPEVAAARAAMVAEVYAACDGKAARRAADAILGLDAVAYTAV